MTAPWYPVPVGISDGYRCDACRRRRNRCAGCRALKAAAQRARRRRYRVAGLCTECGTRAAAGHTRCAEHLASNAARSKRSHATARRRRAA